MERKDLILQLKEAILEVTGNCEGINDETNLRDGLGLDSFAATEVLIILEQKLGITINTADLFQLKIFKDMVDLCLKYFKAK